MSFSGKEEGWFFPVQDLDELGLLGRWRREMRCSVVQACLEVGWFLDGKEEEILVLLPAWDRLLS